MKREIKFKAKSIYNDEWVYGDLVHQIDGTHIYMGKGGNGRTLCPRVDPSTICQFTGLKDCKGNEIWEHDLLQSQETKAIYEVVWNDGGFIISDYVVGVDTMIFLCSALRMLRIKVVGNKYDKAEKV